MFIYKAKELRAGELKEWGDDGPFLTWLKGQVLIRVGRKQSVFNYLTFDLSPYAQGSAYWTTLPTLTPPNHTSHLLSIADPLLTPDNSHGVESAL